MVLRVGTQCSQDDGEETFSVLVDEFRRVIVIPEEEGALGHLEVGALYTLRHPLEQCRSELGEFRGLGQLGDLFQLVEEEGLRVILGGV